MKVIRFHPVGAEQMRRRKWLIVGFVLVCIPCLGLLPCVQTVRDGEGWVRSANSLAQIGLALRNYHDVHGHLPPAVVRDQDGRPLYSWRVVLLPYLEQDTLHRKFRLDEPWDGPNNKLFLQETPRPYEPALGGNDAPGLTRYQVFIGPGTAFERDGLAWADFPDGPANTLLVAEAGEPVPWSKPADLAYDSDGPLPPLGGAFTKPIKLACYVVRRDPGFCACLGEGRGQFIRQLGDDHAIRAFITRNGGEKVDQSVLD